MADNIILPAVPVLEEIDESTKLLIEQAGEINRYPISNLNVNIDVDSYLSTASVNPVQNKVVAEAIANCATTEMINNITPESIGAVNLSKIINNFTTTTEGYVADAKALKTLNDNKIEISKIVNNFTTTDEGYVADARALKELNDTKIDMELVWEKADTTESMAAGSLPLASSDFSHFMVDFIGRQPALIIRKGSRYNCCYMIMGGRASGSTTNHDTTLTFYVREIDFRDTSTTNAAAVADCYYTYFLSDTNNWLAETKSNGAIVPYRIWGIRGIAS